MPLLDIVISFGLGHMLLFLKEALFLSFFGLIELLFFLYLSIHLNLLMVPTMKFTFASHEVIFLKLQVAHSIFQCLNVFIVGQINSYVFPI